MAKAGAATMPAPMQQVRGGGFVRFVGLVAAALAIVFAVWWLDVHGYFGAAAAPPPNMPDIKGIQQGTAIDAFLADVLDFLRRRLWLVSLAWAAVALGIHHVPKWQKLAHQMWWGSALGIVGSVVVLPILEVKLPAIETWIIALVK